MITKEQVTHIAKLAKLELSDEEKDRLAIELGKVINYIDELNEVDTSEVLPTTQVSGLVNACRVDEACNWPADEQRQSLAAAELSQGSLVKVKKIL